MDPTDESRSDAAFPIGTVTFLLSDVEGSTRLWEADPEAMALAMVRHDQIFEEIVSRFGGVRPKEQGEGDSVVAVFPRASEAVACALDLQSTIQGEDWRPRPLRVRMAIHTGEAQLNEVGRYVGQTIIRCARIRSLAHGGQVVLSRGTSDLVIDHLPGGVTLRDLGAHRLKDLARPEHVFQLCHQDLVQDFPPLRSLDWLPNNLPQQLTSFVGRETEMAEIKTLLKGSRMLTLTGSGGAGKTRLALQVAADLLDDYADGVWWVDLGPITHNDLVPKAVAQAMSIREVPMQPITYTLQNQLRGDQLLIVLDNCEHLIDACAELAQSILQTSPSLSILATSREALGVPGEISWRVPSLSLPESDGALGAGEVGRSESVRLFVDRVRKVRPGYELTDQDAPVILEICSRLDGIPLAIELAAARARMLGTKQISEGLEDLFRFLTGGSRTAVPRHQTLQASVEWSHNLLSEEEKTLFGRLSVFAGGFTLEAAENVCSHEPIPREVVLDLVSQLVDKSLLLMEEGPVPRFRMLQTIRQYARDKLEASGEEALARDRHLGFFLAMAERSEPHLEHGDELALLEKLDAEHDNIRAALDWCDASDQFDKGLRLATALRIFWLVRAHISEGRSRLEAGLGAPGADPAVRARALIAASAVADWTGDFPALHAFAEEALRISRELGDLRSAGRALSFLGFRATFLDPSSASDLLEESVAIAREAKDQWCLSYSLNSLGLMQVIAGEAKAGIRYLEESVAVARESRDRMGTQRGLRNLGFVLTFQGKLTQARVLLEEGLGIAREFDDTSAQGVGLTTLGLNAILQGEYEEARRLIEEGLELAHESGSPPIAALSMAALGMLDYALGDLPTAASNLEQALQLFGAMELNWALSAFQPYLAEAREEAGDRASAKSNWEKALALAQESDITWTIGRTQQGVGRLRRLEGKLAEARELQIDALRRVSETGDLMALAESLEELGLLSAAEGNHEAATRVLAAVQALRDTIRYTRFPIRREKYERELVAIRQALGNEFDRVWGEGVRLTGEQAVDLAISLSRDPGAK